MIAIPPLQRFFTIFSMLSCLKIGSFARKDEPEQVISRQIKHPTAKPSYPQGYLLKDYDCLFCLAVGLSSHNVKYPRFTYSVDSLLPSCLHLASIGSALVSQVELSHSYRKNRDFAAM